MASKKTTSSSTLKTLKGLFELPKMKHRRDFLRENKLNLKELQRTTTNKLLQIQNEQDKRQHMHLQHYQKQQELLAAKRSRSKRLSAGEENQHSDQNVTRQRSQSQLRNEACSVLVKHDGYNNGDVNYCCCTHLPPAERHNRLPRSASSHSAISKAESCDKEIQTEDINDEQFLYEALKKCSTADVVQQMGDPTKKISSNDIDNNYESTTLQPNKYDNDQVGDSKSEQFLYYNPNDDCQKHNEDNKSQLSYQMSENKFPTALDAKSQHSLPANDLIPRTHSSTYLQQSHQHQHQHQHKYNNDHRKDHKTTNHAGHRNDCIDNLESQMQDLDVEATNCNIPEHEMQASARSRRTITSQLSKKKSTGSLHKAGASRSDVRLPRYLEKEKREKEEERLRELALDPNCPIDHYVLSDEERLKALNDNQKKVSVLIQELNRMPMTTETLRLRSRKVEIEKELSQLEANIRLLSKPKVYLPLSNEQ